ncbi:MAG: DUF1540 domain-containing protein [Betaproteobacteria bacterium]
MGRITGVKCTVSECAYWGSGNVCEADAIEVDRNSALRGGARDSGMEVGRIGERGEARGRARATDVEVGRIGERGGAAAGTEFAVSASEHTMCKTFKPKAAGYTR